MAEDTDGFIDTLKRESVQMRAIADLPLLPNADSWLMVEWATYTVAADAACGRMESRRHQHIRQ
ncbi:hypothetical protein [Sulfitobacter sp. MF3-043]|uniref:hypothetical protein n=1 Tax=Sulfitobacter sediminivivens TaxID=3252902 RepID=UPI0036DA3F50